MDRLKSDYRHAPSDTVPGLDDNVTIIDGARWASSCGVIALAIAAVVLLGWMTDAPLLKSLRPGWIAMQPVTALGFSLAGALLLPRAARWQPALLAGLATLAAGQLWEYASGHTLGIDDLLFSEAVRAQPNYLYPGRMAEATAVEFLLFAAGIALPHRLAWQQRLLSALGTLGLSLAMVSVAGYIFGAQGLTTMWGYTQMALGTAGGFVALFFGLKLSRPPEAWFQLLLSRTAGGSAVRRLMPLVVCWPLLAGLLINLLSGSSTAEHRLTTAMLLVAVIVGQMWVITAFARRLNGADRLRRAAERRLHTRNAHLTLLAEGAQQLLFSDAPAQLVQRLCERVMAHLDCQVFCHFISVPGQSRMRLNAQAGITTQALEGLCCPDARQHHDCFFRAGFQAKADGERRTILDLGMRAHACHSLVYQGRHIGKLFFGSRTRTAFSEEDMALMQTVADLVAAAMARKEGEEALRESESRLRLALEGAHAGYWEWNLETGDLTASDKEYDIYGIAPGPHTLADWQDALHPVDLPGMKARLQETLAGTQNRFRDEFRIQHPQRGVRWLLALGNIVRTPEGKPVRLYGINIDITDQKAGEQLLEQRVAERTAELSAANQELEGFTYAASHDMKAPLGRIDSFSTLLARHYRDRLEGDGLLFLDFIQQNARRLNILIEDLLAHAQIGQQILPLEPVDVVESVQAILEERSQEIAQGKIEIRLELPPRLVVPSHPLVFNQVLRNLVDNAIKYSGQSRPPRIEIGTAPLEGCWRLWVRDNGIGLNMVYKDRIFEIFRRLHTYTEYPGTGVGLALVKKAMDRLGGKVWVDSEPGQGATFFLEFDA